MTLRAALGPNGKMEVSLWFEDDDPRRFDFSASIEHIDAMADHLKKMCAHARAQRETGFYLQ